MILSIDAQAYLSFVLDDIDYVTTDNLIACDFTFVATHCVNQRIVY